MLIFRVIYKLHLDRQTTKNMGMMTTNTAAASAIYRQLEEHIDCKCSRNHAESNYKVEYDVKHSDRH